VQPQQHASVAERGLVILPRALLDRLTEPSPTPPVRLKSRLALLAVPLFVVLLTFIGIESITLLFVASIIEGIGEPALLVLLLHIAPNLEAMQGKPIPDGWRARLGNSRRGIAYNDGPARKSGIFD
jgi:hypothetical protein